MAAKRKPKDTIYYGEYFDCRGGAQTSIGWITRADLRKIAEAEKAERDNDGLPADAPHPEDLWDDLMHTDDTLYMLNEVFGYDVKNPVRSCAAILKAIESVNGNWGRRVEEGSIAFGLSKQMVLDKLDKLEGPSRLR